MLMLDPIEIAGIAGGAALLVVGRALMIVNRKRHSLDRALADQDPMVRRAAIDLVDERTISTHIDVLVERALVETDPDVRAALARTLSRGEWQPGDDPRVLQLRAWAGQVGTPSDAERADATRTDAIGSDSSSSAVDAAEKPVVIGAKLEMSNVDDSSSGAVGFFSDEPQSASVPEDVPAWTGSTIDRALVRPSPESHLADKRLLESGSNGRPVNTDDQMVARREVGITKAEQAAVNLLRSAGYAVAAQNAADSMGEDPAPTPAQSTDELRILTDLCVQRAITTAIFEEAARRMRVENDRLEALLARLRERG